MDSYNKLFHKRTFSPVLGTSNLTCSRFVPCLLGLLLTALLTTAPAASASILDLQGISPTEILIAQRAIEDSVTQNGTNPTIMTQDSLVTVPAAERKEKSAGKAFMYSLAIPGTGHLYAGYKRGWGHLGVEGLTWVTYFYYHGLGTSKEDEFEGYADDHWDYARWISACGCSGTDADKLIVNFQQNNKQQYYEDIGKIPTYFQGWDDYEAQKDDSANRHFYRGMRNDSNNYLKNARYALVVAFVNRIVSAVDVLRLVKKEKTAVPLGSDTSLHFKMRTKPFSRENAIAFNITKRL